MAKSVCGMTKVSLVVIVCVAILQGSLGEQRICGPAINQVMSLMCPSGTKPLNVKRGSMLDGELDEGNNNEDNFSFSFDMIPHWASMETNTLAKIRRRREGIYHECCLKPCSKSEIMSYCLV